MKMALRWLALTVSLASWMSGSAAVLFLGATWLIEAVIQHYWRGDDDWLWLMLPAGAILGLSVGARFRARIWSHMVSVVLGVGLAAFLVWVSVSATSQPRDLDAAIGRTIAVWMGRVLLAVVAVSLVVAGTVSAMLLLFRRRLTRPG